MRSELLRALGGEEGCRRLSADFYARVGKDPALRRLFPGKSLRCATEEFAAFLIQFLGGDEEQTQHRWWLSLRESHTRFRISAAERGAWLRHMNATLAAAPLEASQQEAFREFFRHSSSYVMAKESSEPENEELAALWREQRALDETIAAIAAGQEEAAMALAQRFAARPAVFAGLLGRMAQAGRAELRRFVMDALERDRSLGTRRFAGRTMLHVAAGAGCLDVVALLLKHGIDPNLPDRGGHAPLYCVANQCALASGPELVRLLVSHGADVNARGGVTRATALHMAARRGFVSIARALLDCGAAIEAKDSKGHTPWQRAVNCRQHAVARLLRPR